MEVIIDAIDTALEKAVNFVDAAKDLLSNSGAEVLGVAAKNVTAMASSHEVIAGGHHQKPKTLWYSALSVGERKKLSYLVTTFEETLANSSISDNVDVYIEKLRTEMKI